LAVKDYYRLLGVDRESSGEEIKKAYRKMARTYHPDLNQDKPGYEERLKEINEAYQVLRDEGKRRLYDLSGRSSFNGYSYHQGNSSDDLIEILRVFSNSGLGLRGWGGCKGRGLGKRGCGRWRGNF